MTIYFVPQDILSCNGSWVNRVGSDQPSMVWVWKIFPKNDKFFNFFLFRSKKSLWVGSKSTRFEGGSTYYLLRVKSVLRPGQGPSLILSRFFHETQIRMKPFFFDNVLGCLLLQKTLSSFCLRSNHSFSSRIRRKRASRTRRGSNSPC